MMMVWSRVLAGKMRKVRYRLKVKLTKHEDELNAGADGGVLSRMTPSFLARGTGGIKYYLLRQRRKQAE